MSVLNIVKYNIWKFLDNHKRLNYIRFCFQYRNNEKIVNTILGKNEDVLFIEHLGKDNPNGLIYFIDGVRKGDGFFAEYRRTLNYLYYADLYGMSPVVYYSKDYLYAEEKPINGVSNPFEYFYKQPVGISLDSALNSCNVIKSDFAHCNCAEHIKLNESGYAVETEYITEMARIARKYIHYQDELLLYLQKESNNILDGNKVLGIHYRGGDFKKNYKNHPNLVSLDDYMEAIDEAMKTQKFDKIFVATDDEGALNTFRGKYGDSILFYGDVMRTSDDISVAFSVCKRENHHYLLGIEVLRDMFTLAHCDGLIAGLSQVSICTLIEREKENEKFQFCKIIDKGLSKNKKIYTG